MAAQKRPVKSTRRRRKPATTPEAREQQLAAMAFDLAEKQIREGTASSQIITQALKYGSTREQLEQEKIRHENELSQVKREAIESQKKVEELYIGALDAMRSYSGNTPESPDEFED